MEKTGQIHHKKFVYLDNPEQNIWNKIEKFSNIEQDQKKLLLKFNFWKGDWALVYVST